jgi:predicted dithiol-disulfide oxidoreductase (DUF899 family)
MLAGSIVDQVAAPPRVAPHEELWPARRVAMSDHRVVSREEWIIARQELLGREKELTRLRDHLSRARRELPWVRVGKEHVFDGVDGKETLAELFGGRSQLLVYHFMFDPSWSEGCKSCSFWADSFNGIIAHLAHRDVTMVAVSRAPLDALEAFRKRMGCGSRRSTPTSTVTITCPSPRRSGRTGRSTTTIGWAISPRPRPLA